MARGLQVVLGVAVVLLVAAVPVLYSSHRQVTLRNFHVVEDGVLYRSGQLSPEAFARVLDEYRIKTVVTLRGKRDKDRPFPDEWEAAACETRGARHVRIEPQVWTPDDQGDIPAEHNVERFFEVMRDRRNHPVLVHCFAGIHRTGTMCALYRLEFDRWGEASALAEMHACGFEPEADEGTRAIARYLRGYKPTWRK